MSARCGLNQLGGGIHSLLFFTNVSSPAEISGFSCHKQIERGTGGRTSHLAQYQCRCAVSQNLTRLAAPAEKACACAA